MRPDIIIETLLHAGFEAYYVGGCVRDTLLGRPVHDWDITTSARPEQVMAVFPRCIPTGVKHGTVTVLLDGCTAEVTTYRVDGEYEDARRPEHVEFVRSLREDLARRDFTVNAMAMDRSGRITDLFDGRDDLHARVIRCVGDPDRRFSEDALRMLRAIRFSAQLGFSVESETMEALRRQRSLCARLSCERVQTEAEKTLLSPEPERFGEMMSLGLLTACGLSGEADVSLLRHVPARRDTRWAAAKLCAQELDPVRFRLPAALCRQIETCARTWQTDRSELDWKRLIAAEGWDAARLQAAMQGSPAVDRIADSGECVSLAQLAVTGRDFPELQGPCVGSMLHVLLGHVLVHPEDNSRERLLTLAQTINLEKGTNNS